MPLSNLPAALLHHAALAGEEPWLFRSEGWDWRWHPWAELARQAAAWAGALSALPPGSRAAFLYRARPEAVVLDLALQMAGLVSVPVSGERETIAEWGCAWVEIEGDGLRFEVSPPSPSLLSPGGVVVGIGGNPVEIGAVELMGMAERVQGEIAPSRRAGEREIAVLGGPLERPEERAMLSWATMTRAAVALEPEPGLRIATAAWVRPTVFHGTEEEIGALRSWVEKGRRRRLPFGRLRTVLVAGGGELPAEEAAFWSGRGVKLGRV